MSIILQPDDLAPGQHVTVFGPARRPRAVHLESPRAAARFFARQLASAGEGALEMPPPGVPLRVHAVSLPFVLCAVLAPGGAPSAAPAVIDLRRVRLARLNDEFVAALADFAPPETKPADDEGATPDDPDDALPSAPLRVINPTDRHPDTDTGNAA